jgi:hypothetical protein
VDDGLARDLHVRLLQFDYDIILILRAERFYAPCGDLQKQLEDVVQKMVLAKTVRTCIRKK